MGIFAFAPCNERQSVSNMRKDAKVNEHWGMPHEFTDLEEIWVAKIVYKGIKKNDSKAIDRTREFHLTS